MAIQKLLIEVSLELNTDRRSVESVIEEIYTGVAKVISDGEFDTLDVNLVSERKMDYYPNAYSDFAELGEV